MLSEGSPNVNRPACGKKIRKINKQFLYHRDPMWPLSQASFFAHQKKKTQAKIGQKLKKN